MLFLALKICYFCLTILECFLYFFYEWSQMIYLFSIKYYIIYTMKLLKILFT